MIRGLVIREAFYLFGAIPFGSVLHVLDASPEFAGLMVILYAIAGGCYFGHYCVKHQDEIPTRAGDR